MSLCSYTKLIMLETWKSPFVIGWYLWSK